MVTVIPHVLLTPIFATLASSPFGRIAYPDAIFYVLKALPTFAVWTVSEPTAVSLDWPVTFLILCMPAFTPTSKMPPVGGKAKSKGQSREVRRSRSRNTTPISSSGTAMSASVENGTTPYLHTPKAHLMVPLNMTLEEIMGSSNGGPAIPTATALNEMADRVKHEYLPQLRHINQACDKGMRQLAERRKEHAHLERERAGREEEERRHKLKKMSKKSEKGEERPLAVGAHGVARQDGVDVHKGLSDTALCSARPTFLGVSSCGSLPLHEPALQLQTLA